MTDGDPPECGRAQTMQGLPTRRLVRTVLRPSRNLVGVELLGRYAVERALGEGGMATVYAGRHITIGRPVAIKVLHDELAAQSEPVSWFLLEARAASRVLHENVVEITDFGATPDGHVFLVMELLEGENLSRTLARDGAMPWTRASAMMLQVCAALGAAHAAGVVHRDLKPSNCFRITRSGTDDFIKVLDFGIATVTAKGAAGSGLRRTDVGVIAGTPEYMAPEQARGEECDHRADVYAAGAILYELVTGCPPYEAGSGAELMAFHLHAAVPDPCETIEGLPPGVTEIVARAMAKDPEQRWADMGALADAIRKANRVVLQPHPRRHGRAWLGAAATIVIAAAAGWVARDDVGELADAREPAPVSAPASAPAPAPAEESELTVAAPKPAPRPAVLPAPPAPPRIREEPAPVQRSVANVEILAAPPPPPPLVTGDDATRPKAWRKRKRGTAAAPGAGNAAAPADVDPNAPRVGLDEAAGRPRSEVKNPFAD